MAQGRIWTAVAQRDTRLARAGRALPRRYRRASRGARTPPSHCSDGRWPAARPSSSLGCETG
eukprot:scaffold49897_cov32-Tisochrysis_lutea.AAC.3